MRPGAATREALGRVCEGLDLAVLGRVYCDEGGEAFWEEKLPEVRRLGLRGAEALGARLPRGGTSLYAGAGVAEIPAWLFEVLELGRTVRAANTRTEEVGVLRAAFTAAGLGDRVAIEATDAARLAGAARYDHLSCVSVLSDPETFPELAELAYGRRPPALVEPARYAEEHGRARALVQALWQGLQRPGWITTTFEEVPWFLARADAEGVPVAADEELVETALVGDPVGFLRVG